MKCRFCALPIRGEHLGHLIRYPSTSAVIAPRSAREYFVNGDIGRGAEFSADCAAQQSHCLVDKVGLLRSRIDAGGNCRIDVNSNLHRMCADEPVRARRSFDDNAGESYLLAQKPRPLTPSIPLPRRSIARVRASGQMP